ncbi:MAG TPA: trypsin-like peptidase domain-containing protein [Longimicrobiales bacterium]|nr:trypsin-like peptidase domain-containing protein [Longimicrobiales bacterium]
MSRPLRPAPALRRALLATCLAAFDPGGVTAPAALAAQTGIEQLDASRRTAIVRAAERVGPSVVSVYVARTEQVQPRTLLESFFMPRDAQREVTGLGSGFIIDAEGLVVTNEHVVRGASVVGVTLPDGRDLEARIVGVDDVNDLALLRVLPPDGETLRLPVAPLGDSDDILTGEWVVAIGNPLGFILATPGPTVTAGVVSGVSRDIIPFGDDRGVYFDMIQTDASINPGNSGGPLVNALGEVIGVNSSIISRGGGSEGLGFAIPIDRVRRVVSELLSEGRVRRAWVGVDVEAAQPNRWGHSREVVITAVAPGSPGAEAGLRVGHVIERVGNRLIRTPLDWEAALIEARVGAGVEVVVRDDARARTLRLTPRDLPSLTAERVRALAGFELITLTPQIRAERGLASERGALIASLPEAAARELGLREGDLIVQINRTPIADADDAARALRALSGRGPARLFYERGGRYHSTSFYVR